MPSARLSGWWTAASFSAVARTLGVGQPALNKQIAAPEVYLGAQLLQRTSRNLTLTEAGRDFYESGVRLLGELEPPGGTA